MKSINQFIYSIATILAVISACSALPIEFAPHDGFHISELVIGLALICIIVTILTCTCCNQNKGGFEEFENENTIADQSNSVSEFPIFRAISPSNAGPIFNNVLNNPDNRILSNIVNQNQINRTFNEFENSQNNNGPISIVDMENIQNNNAVGFIPIIDSMPHPINRNLLNENSDEQNSNGVNSTASINIEQSQQILMPEYNVNIASSSNNYKTYCQLNISNENGLENPPAVSESLNNYIGLDYEAETRTQIDKTIKCHSDEPNSSNVINCEKVFCEQYYEKENVNIGFNLNDDDDDAVSVEEALRVLDFAISGGESIFSDYQDTSSDESEHECHERHFPKEIEQIDKPKDIVNKTVAKICAENSNNVSNTQHNRANVYEVAKELVDSMLEECIEKVSLMTHLVREVNDEHKMKHNRLLNGLTPESIHTYQKDREIETNTLDDSMEEIFVIGKLEASTPCQKVNYEREKNKFGINLFQTLDEVNESALSIGDGVKRLQESQNQIVCTTFEVQPNENQLTATFVKSDEKNFVADLQKTFEIETYNVKAQIDVPTISQTIKIDKEDDLKILTPSTTPMNTPIELDYVGDAWGQFVAKSSKKKSINLQDNTTDQLNASMLDTSKNSWYLQSLHINDNDNEYSIFDGVDEDSETVEENPELLSLTFDALRKKLADVLPEASVRPSVEYSDDEDNVSDSDHDCETLEYNNRLENPRSEVFINYKQQLSPILEESEDETCKTFVLNETKCFDSTSTACIETSEAIMGVTKVLMASNDTLFNFEDTLGDREDMFLSPRNIIGSGSSTANSITPQPENCKTPTNEAYLHVYPSFDFNVSSENQLPIENHPNSLQLNLDNLINNPGDLLSPEQQKTFSEEINTIEQLSSDPSATIDATNTLDDLRTCISVHLIDDANNTKLEYTTHGNVFANDNESIEIVECNSAPNQILNVYETQMPAKCQIIQEKLSDKSSEFMITENFKENQNPNMDPLIVTKPEEKNDNSKTIELIQISDKYNNQPQSEPSNANILHESDEDRWSHPINDIRFLSPSSDDVLENMTVTLATNDWDSDIDIEDSNSSEEFVFAKEASQMGEYLRSSQNMNGTETENSIKKIELNQEVGDEQINTQDIWNSHEDLIAVTTKVDTDDMLEDSSISENETEWVPSAWDHLAKPARSALKSPDKSSSRAGTKNRRTVVFKKQSYQSVYEYPKENVSLSPTVNEVSEWKNLASSNSFNSSMNGSYVVRNSNDSNGSQIDFNALDGFAISSSTKPFHLRQFGSDCHTWPTDSEFSWSQIQSDKEHVNSDINYASESMVRSTNSEKLSEMNNIADGKMELKSSSSIYRSECSVGESADVSESLSIGDLCHAKSSLWLPLHVYTVIEKDVVQSIAPTSENQNEASKSHSQKDNSENVAASDSIDSIVPTSCTGSMDSINSFDGGKSSLIHLNDSTNTNTDGQLNTTEIRNNSNESPVYNDININTNKKCDFRTTGNRQSDSTDEDSGIENIVRVTKEILK